MDNLLKFRSGRNKAFVGMLIFLVSRTCGKGKLVFISYQCRLLSKHFFLQSFSSKDSVSLLLAQFSGSVGSPHGRHRKESVGNLGLKIVGKYISLGLSYIQLSFMHVCKCLNQRVKLIKQNGKSFKRVSKTKKKKSTLRD